jgi:hypothetical protein
MLSVFLTISSLYTGKGHWKRHVIQTRFTRTVQQQAFSRLEEDDIKKHLPTTPTHQIADFKSAI